jgi:histidyl-tRNA synthetase
VRDDATATSAFATLAALRGAGFSAQMEQAGRSVKGQFKQADRLGARAVVIAGEDGLSIRNMETGHQRDAPGLLEAVEALREILE